MIPRLADLKKSIGVLMSDKGKMLTPGLAKYDPSKPLADFSKELALWGHHAYVVVPRR